MGMAHDDHINWKRIFSLPSIVYTLGGVICAVIALKGLMIPNHFIDGGITVRGGIIKQKAKH